MDMIKDKKAISAPDGGQLIRLIFLILLLTVLAFFVTRAIVAIWKHFSNF